MAKQKDDLLPMESEPDELIESILGLDEEIDEEAADQILGLYASMAQNS